MYSLQSLSHDKLLPTLARGRHKLTDGDYPDKNRSDTATFIFEILAVYVFLYSI